MPFCPVCRAEYRPGFTICADDSAVLVDQLPPPEHRPELAAVPSNSVSVARVDGLPVAEMLTELLSNKGIEGWVVPTSDHSRLEVRVAPEDAERARTIVPRHRQHSARRDERVLDEVDRALQHGDVDLADRLLSSVEQPAAPSGGIGWRPFVIGGAVCVLALVVLIVLAVKTIL